MNTETRPERPKWAIKIKVGKGIPPAKDLIQEMMSEGFFHVQILKESSEEEPYYVFSTEPLSPYEILSWEEKKVEDLFSESLEAENHFCLKDNFPGAGTFLIGRAHGQQKGAS